MNNVRFIDEDSITYIDVARLLNTKFERSKWRETHDVKFEMFWDIDPRFGIELRLSYYTDKNYNVRFYDRFYDKKSIVTKFDITNRRPLTDIFNELSADVQMFFIFNLDVFTRE